MTRFALIIAHLFITGILHGNQYKNREYEIISHKAGVTLIPGEAMSCTDTLSIRMSGGGADSLILNILPAYRIENIFLEGEKIEAERRGNYLKIALPGRDTLRRIIVDYSGPPDMQTEFSRFSKDGAVLMCEELLPGGASSLEFVRLTLKTLSDWETIAVGRRVRTDTSVGMSASVWEYDGYLPSLGWICAGKFIYHNLALGSVDISTHLFPEDSGSAREILFLARDIIRFYSREFSPYRFEKFAVVEVEDWIAGKNVLAVASPSFVMVKRMAFTTQDTFNSVISVLAHEIAHQWWSMTVFPGDSDIAFLSEGMCEYSSRLYNEKRGTMTKRDSLGRHPLLRPLLMRIRQGRDIPLKGRTDLRYLTTHYLKAAYVHNMLRRLVGDTLFVGIYREYARKYSAKNSVMEDFQKIAEEISGKDLGWFFDQWVLNRGAPRLKLYNVKTVRERGNWLTTGRIRVIGYDRFSLSAAVGVETEDGFVEERFTVGRDSAGDYRNDIPFKIISVHKPFRAVLDPAGDILKMQNLPPKISDLREPRYGIMITGTLKNSAALLNAARRDSGTLSDAGWSIGLKCDTSATLSDLQNDCVFLYGKADDNLVVSGLADKFPSPHRRDITAAQESAGGSPSTLIQIIENLYLAHGLMVWIAPPDGAPDYELLPFDVSWIVLQGGKEIASGTWEVRDENLDFKIE